MAEKAWEVVQVCYCQHVGQEVNLEAQMVYPAEWLPEQPARILGHRCSQGTACSLKERPSCTWAGTNPNFDPFLQA